MNDVSEHQLDALAGSKALHVEVFFQGQFRPSPKALASGTRRLLAALKDSEVGQYWLRSGSGLGGWRANTSPFVRWQGRQNPPLLMVKG